MFEMDRVAGLFGVTVLCLLGSVKCVQTIYFEDMCNGTLSLDDAHEAIVLIGRYDGDFMLNCSLTITTRNTWTGVLMRLKSDAFRPNDMDFECEQAKNKMVLANTSVNLCENYYNEVVWSNPVDRNTMITLVRSSFRFVVFTLMLSIYTEPTNIACPPLYTRCFGVGCVPQTVYCYQDYDFCSAGSRCQDSSSNQPTSFNVWQVFFPVTLSIILIGLIYYFCCVRGKFLNVHQKVKSVFCCSEPPAPQRPLRAQDVFIIRTSEDDDGTDAREVDPRMFDAPPPYSSLEHLPNPGVRAYDNKVDISDELPPDYQAVMLNMAVYKVDTPSSSS